MFNFDIKTQEVIADFFVGIVGVFLFFILLWILEVIMKKIYNHSKKLKKTLLWLDKKTTF